MKEITVMVGQRDGVVIFHFSNGAVVQIPVEKVNKNLVVTDNVKQGTV